MKKLIKKLLREHKDNTPKGTYIKRGDVEGYKINPYEAETTDLEEFLNIIDGLPDTIKRLSVPTETNIFNPRNVIFNPKEDQNWRENVKDIIIDIDEEYENVSYSINSYFGAMDSHYPYDEHPLFISYGVPNEELTITN